MGAKLIRDHMDKIPWKVEAAKGLLRPPNDEQEFRELLIQKLLEEVGELVVALPGQAMANEMADVLEVLDGISHLANIRHQVQQAKIERFLARGGFQEGLVWDV